MDIIYRACEIDSCLHRPAWFDKKKCFKSLIDSLDNYRSRVSRRWWPNLHCVLDGEEKELADYIKSFPYVTYKNIQEYNNHGSLLHCLNLAQDLAGDSVYLLEDDYIHLPEAIRYLDDGVQKFGLVTGYDHMDRYRLLGQPDQDITAGQEMIGLGQFCHWRTAESTTCTWAAQRDCLEKIIDKAIRHLSSGQDREFFRDVFVDLGIRLFTPVPGVSTHVYTNLFSPYIEWEEVNNSISL